MRCRAAVQRNFVRLQKWAVRDLRKIIKGEYKVVGWNKTMEQHRTALAGWEAAL